MQNFTLNTYNVLNKSLLFAGLIQWKKEGEKIIYKNQLMLCVIYINQNKDIFQV